MYIVDTLFVIAAGWLAGWTLGDKESVRINILVAGIIIMILLIKIFNSLEI